MITQKVCMCVTFEDILKVLFCTVLADNGISLIFFMISVLFLKSLNRSSAQRMKQYLTYSSSVNGFHVFEMRSDIALTSENHVTLVE